MSKTEDGSSGSGMYRHPDGSMHPFPPSRMYTHPDGSLHPYPPSGVKPGQVGGRRPPPEIGMGETPPEPVDTVVDPVMRTLDRIESRLYSLIRMEKDVKDIRDRAESIEQRIENLPSELTVAPVAAPVAPVVPEPTPKGNEPWWVKAAPAAPAPSHPAPPVTSGVSSYSFIASKQYKGHFPFPINKKNKWHCFHFTPPPGSYRKMRVVYQLSGFPADQKFARNGIGGVTGAKISKYASSGSNKMAPAWWNRRTDLEIFWKKGRLFTRQGRGVEHSAKSRVSLALPWTRASRDVKTYVVQTTTYDKNGRTGSRVVEIIRNGNTVASTKAALVHKDSGRSIHVTPAGMVALCGSMPEPGAVAAQGVRIEDVTVSLTR